MVARRRTIRALGARESWFLGQPQPNHDAHMSLGRGAPTPPLWNRVLLGREGLSADRP